VLPAGRERTEGHDLASEAERQGFAVRTVETSPVAPGGASGPGGADSSIELTSPGVVLFTSGSTDLPKPVYRPLDRVFVAARSLVKAFDLAPGGGVLGTLPLARGYGLIHALAVASALGGRLALLDRFQPASVLGLLAAERYEYWPGTPVMADLLGRHPVHVVPPAPRISVVAGRLPEVVCQRFESRFGVSLRQTYGTTETGPVTADAAPAGEAHPETSGRPLPGVRLAIGDDPHRPAAAGVLGRVWVSSPGQMLGYGFPPRIEPPESAGDWLATRDVGRVDASGALALAGRVDDCIRTAGGYLVNPADIALAVEDYAGVTDCAVVPLGQKQGAALGVLVQGAQDLDVAGLRRHLGRRLPPWCQPRLVALTSALPRLAGGKTDRRACIELLEGSDPGSGTASPRFRADRTAAGQ
jgi:acyl-coenzyme A synthetase/AMP-(fatty) acid ligase